MSAELNQTWQRVTAPGQVKVGTKIRFMLGDELRHETAKLILHAGTAKEEVIYNKRQNWYFITSMAMNGTGSQKNIEFLATAAASQAQPAQQGEGNTDDIDFLADLKKAAHEASDEWLVGFVRQHFAATTPETWQAARSAPRPVLTVLGLIREYGGACAQQQAWKDRADNPTFEAGKSPEEIFALIERAVCEGGE